MLANLMQPFEPTLPRHAGQRRLALICLAGAPLALLLGLVLRATAPVPEDLRVYLSREQMIEAAQSLAASVGRVGEEAAVGLRVQKNDDGRALMLGAPLLVRQALGNVVPGQEFLVTIGEGDPAPSFHVRMNSRGQVLSFHADRFQDLGPKLKEAQALALAEKHVRGWLAYAPALVVEPLKPGVHNDEADSTFTFVARYPAEDWAKFSGKVQVRGSRVVAASLDPSFGDDLGDRYSRNRALAICLAIGAGVLLVFASFYSIRLYRRRSREQEAPRRNALVLALVVGILGGGFILLNLESFAKTDGGILPWYLALVISVALAILYMLGGLLLGAAYASGEGEIREGYPGKMTAFDALLAGRALSGNVGVSVVVGASIAAWLFLLASAVIRFPGAGDATLFDPDLAISAYGRLPWLSGLVGLPLSCALTAVTGLFVPLTFVLRNVKSTRKKWALLVVCPFVMATGMAATTPLTLAGALVAASGVAALLAPFFFHDLLSSLVSSTLFHLAINASTLMALGSHAWWNGIVQLVIVTGGLCLLASAAWNRGQVTEDEVKPAHARNLDQRLSMKAEISAAREAQLRLLPDSPPVLPGLAICACCRPVGDVGADFYDFFPLPDGRLAVFVASGGGLGVASALIIALAKGFLMSDLRRGDAPDRTLARLRELLTGRLGEVAQRARFAVAWVDPRRGTLEAARWGDMPAAWILHAGNAVSGLAFTASPTGLQVARVPLQRNDSLLFHTEGLVSALEDQSPTGLKDWLGSLRLPGDTPHGADLHALLAARLAGGSQKLLARRLSSDLTAVLLRLEEVVEPAREQVA
jgi:hypothetical protein